MLFQFNWILTGKYLLQVVCTFTPLSIFIETYVDKLLSLPDNVLYCYFDKLSSSNYLPMTIH